MRGLGAPSGSLLDSAPSHYWRVRAAPSHSPAPSLWRGEWRSDHWLEMESILKMMGSKPAEKFISYVVLVQASMSGKCHLIMALHLNYIGDLQINKLSPSIIIDNFDAMHKKTHLF